MSAKKIYEFGPFRLDPAERLLLREDKPVALTPKAFDTLVALVEESGHLVRKDDLMKRVWPDAFVEEVNLSQNVSALRRALDTNGDHYIETVPKVGYRLIVKARVVGELESETIGAEQAVAAAPVVIPIKAVTTPVLEESVSKKKTVVIVIGLAAMAVIGLALGIWRIRQRPADAAPIRSLVILPLTNLSGDAGQEYFADGITEELTTEVAKLANAEPLCVISRTTAMRYKNTAHAVPEIGRELHVDAVLEGAVLRSGDHVRITAQLIRAADDEHIWAQSYDRNLADTLAVQSEIAQDIAKEIKLQITPDERALMSRHAMPSHEAQDAYLRGRYAFNKRTSEAIKDAKQYFEKAIDLEPDFALAYAALADYYNTAPNYGLLTTRDAAPKAQAAAQRALELDETIAEAHAALALVKHTYDFDWSGAEKEYRRAIQLNSSYASAHQWFALLLAQLGRIQEAKAEIARGQELDPLALIMYRAAGLVYHTARDYQAEVAECRKALALNPQFSPAKYGILGAEVDAGKYGDAIVTAKALRAEDPDDPTPLVPLARAYARSGMRREAVDLLSDLERRYTEPALTAYERASVYADLGKFETALNLLEIEYESRGFIIAFLKVDPVWDPLRPDPRFQRLMRRMNFPT